MRDRDVFFQKNIFALKSGKIYPKLATKGFVEFIEKIGHQFFLNLVHNESLYYLLCSCTKPISQKNLVPEIWAKMFLANQITSF